MSLNGCHFVMLSPEGGIKFTGKIHSRLERGLYLCEIDMNARVSPSQLLAISIETMLASPPAGSDQMVLFKTLDDLDAWSAHNDSPGVKPVRAGR